MPGKLQPEILRKSVLNFTGALRNDLLVGGGIREDAALIRVPDGILVAASDPVTGAGKNAGKLLVHINANDVACKGADPSWLIVTLVVPDEMGVSYIHDIMREIHEACMEMGIAIAGGHTELTDRYEQPVLSATILGITRHELSAKKIREGDLILVTGHAGLEGMSIIANDRPDLLYGVLTDREMYARGVKISRSLNLRGYFGILPVTCTTLRRAGSTAHCTKCRKGAACPLRFSAIISQYHHLH